MNARIALAALAVLAIAGCGSTASTTATHSATSAKVSPGCELARNNVHFAETGQVKISSRELAENKEMVQEECGAEGRKRYAKAQSESPEETQCKTAKMLLKEAEAENIQSYIREGEAMVEASCGE
jgi:queuine/archaeosine tRNA-ribosyltransferase